MSSKIRTLVYRTVPHDERIVVVFAKRDRAEYVAQVSKAIAESETWGQFKSAMPEEDYWDIVWEVFGEEKENEPTADKPFDSSCVPGFCDGDYPPWMMAEMGRVLPNDILEKHGEYASSVLNGQFWIIPSRNLEAVCCDLTDRGWQLEHRPELDFI